MNQAPSPRCDALRRGGFTLVEVVISLAIFVFGALAIIRIFPPALGVIQNSEDRLTAINLNRSAVAQLSRSPELVPDAIYDNGPAGFVGAVNGTALRNSSLPSNNIQDFDNTALGRFKSISRETHTISTDGSATPKFYVVTQYPYDPNQPVLICQEDEVEGVRMTSNGSLDFSDATLKSTGAAFKDTTNPVLPPLTTPNPTDPIYLNTGANGQLTTRGDTIFYVSYSWIENSNLESVVDEPLIYPTATPSQTVQGRRGGTQPVVGPVQVRFRRLKYNPATASPALIPIAGDDFRGVIDLPAPSPSAPPDSFSFVRGEKISLDYTLKDWRWLVNNETPSLKPEDSVASDDYRAVNSPVRFFDKDQTLYTLLSDQDGNRKGAIYQGSLIAPSEGLRLTDTINVKTGQVVFDLSALPNTATSARARVVYRTLDNWANQLSVAARSYKPYYSGVLSTPAEPWRDYVNTSGTRQILQFRPSEAGKSVAVSYVYTVGGADVEVNNKVLQIDARIITSSAFTGGLATELQLTDNSGNTLTNAQVKGIRSVLGVSIQSRTAWLDGNKFSQVSSVALRGIK